MTRRIRMFFLLGAASIVVIFLYAVRGVLTPFALAAAIAYLVHPLVRLFEQRQMPRSMAILVVYVVFGVTAALSVYTLVPLLIRELNSVINVLPENVQALEQYSSRLMRRLARIPGAEPLRGMFELALDRLEVLVQSAANRALDALLGLFSRTLHFLLAPFLAFYLLRDAELIQRNAISLIPANTRPEVVALAQRLNRVASGFIRGQLIVSAAVGLLVGAGLAVLRVPYAALIGVLSGLFDVVPYFGPIIGSMPAVLFGLMRSPATALWAVVWIIVVQQLEGAVLHPRVMSGHVGLHPLVVIFAVLAGGSLFGVAGMLVAVPVAAGLKVTGAYLLEKLTSAP